MGQASFELTQGVKGPAALRLLTDDRLARRAADGDRGAFAVIFERHHQGLYRYCRAILRHDEDARDALQTTFTRAIAALDGDERAVKIKPWLYRIAHNEAISLLRRRRPLDSIDGQPDLASRTPGPDDRVLASERMRQLLADLEQLPERQRWALLLRELNDLTYPDIAAAIATSEQAARQSVYEARVMLMELKQGREMPCTEVRQLVSERDGRLLRPRKVRAHLRACESCAGFRASIDTRRADLGALAPPLPAAAAAALLNAVLGGGGGGGWGGGGLAAVLGAGKGAAAAAGSKGVATAAALTIAGGALVTTTVTIPPIERGEQEGTKPAAIEVRATPSVPAAPLGSLPATVTAGFTGARPTPLAAGPHDAPRATQPAAAKEQPPEETVEGPLATPHPVATREPAAEDAPAGAVPGAAEIESAPHGGAPASGGGQAGNDKARSSPDARHPSGNREHAAADDEAGAHGASNGNRGSKPDREDVDRGPVASSSSTRAAEGRTSALQAHDDAGRDKAAAAMLRRDDRGNGNAKAETGPKDDRGNGNAKSDTGPNDDRGNGRGSGDVPRADDERGNANADGNAGRDAGRPDSSAEGGRANGNGNGNGNGNSNANGNANTNANANANANANGNEDAPSRATARDDEGGGDGDARQAPERAAGAGGDGGRKDQDARDEAKAGGSEPRGQGDAPAKAANARPAKSPR